MLASPPSVRYRVGKFVRRHRVGVAAATALVVMLVAFAGTTLVQSRRIAGERDRANREAEAARQVSNFLVGLFNVSDPSESRGNSLTAREILVNGARRIQGDLREQPVVQARLEATIGTVYTGLGLYTDAQPLLDEALIGQRRALGDDNAETLVTANALANLYWYQEKYQEAEPLYQDIVRRRTRVLGPEHPDTLRAQWDLASLYVQLKRWGEAELSY